MKNTVLLTTGFPYWSINLTSKGNAESPTALSTAYRITLVFKTILVVFISIISVSSNGFSSVFRAFAILMLCAPFKLQLLMFIEMNLKKYIVLKIALSQQLKCFHSKR